MTEDDRELLQRGAAYRGPTLDGAKALLEKMDRVPLCAVCPAAQWYLTVNKKGDQELEAFCTRFRGIMYDGRKIVTACDAREDAIANAGS